MYTFVVLGVARPSVKPRLEGQKGRTEDWLALTHKQFEDLSADMEVDRGLRPAVDQRPLEVTSVKLV
jgi:hypothetical protein